MKNIFPSRKQQSIKMKNISFKSIKSLLILFGLTIAACSCGGGGSTCPAYSQEYNFDHKNEINLTLDQKETNTENEI